jgi:flagellar M-ring protein FliF
VANFDQTLSKLTTLGKHLDTRQQVSLLVAFVTVVGLVGGTAWWISRPTYTLLFDDMDQSAAAEVVSKLEAQKVDYKLDPGGHGIRVPTSEVDKLRLDLSAQGLPSSGRIGFEIFDRTAFGQTEFLEHVNYRRALEGEIARTIATISEVSGARVHIAMAKDSLFGAREQPAKASVVLKLKNQNRPLQASTVVGVTNLVAASVEGLRPEAVVVLDSFGRPLSRPESEDDGTPLGAAQMERQQRLERETADRVVALLTPVVGADRVRANVSVRLSSSSEEQTEEKWDPASVVRSHQTSSDVTPTSGLPMASMSTGPNVAGARANLPPTATPAGVPPPPVAVQAAANAATRSTDTTNYEISRTTRHTVTPGGGIARLSVAVILDDEQVTAKEKDGTVSQKTRSRKPEEIQKIQQLVSTAVGLDTSRGDQLTVENIAFDAPPVEEPSAPTLVEQYAPAAGEGLKIVVALGLVAVAFFVVIRPLMRQALSPPQMAMAAPGMGQLPRTVRDLEGEIEAQLDAAAQEKQLETIKMPVLTKKANALVQKEPEAAAKLLRSWLGEEEAGRR